MSREQFNTEAMKPPKPSSRARARELTKVEQEDHIIQLMLAGRWYGGRSAEELAKEWDIHPRTVSDRALVASGVVHRRGSPIEEFIDRKLAELEALQAAAMNEVKWYVVDKELVSVPAHNVPAAVRAVELQAKLKGALVQKVEKRTLPAQLNPEERLEALRQAQAALPEEIAELEAQVKERVHH